eukprot:TRINITY_DN170_c0_g1_i3.p1 TRINITY_DN170_c0_g1~~TRINITY_DN170_c0_g1_i3.p1  ORF type:complete len:317 (-),score=140.92 TRINITY_DN170_c0_g1_i3:17-967(-)
MRIVVTGSSGLLGRAVVREFVAAGHTVVGLVFTRSPSVPDDVKQLVSYERCDLTDAAAVESLFASLGAIDVVVHCAAERQPDKCINEPDRVRALNVEASERLAKAASAANAWLLYVSTDYIFDGTAPPYKANATPNPLNAYGEAKLAGEVAARAAKPDTGVLRVGVLYSNDVETLGESSVTSLLQVALDSATSEQPVAVDNWGRRFPTHVADVAFVLRGLAERKEKRCDFRGTFHLCGKEEVSKFDIARSFAELVGVDVGKLVANSSEPSGAKRPQNTQLDCSALELMGLARHTPLREGLASVVEHYQNHLKDKNN